MIIVKLTGGLGNQMFQYAAGRALSLKRGVPLKLDVGWFETNQAQRPKRRYELGIFLPDAALASRQDISEVAPLPDKFYSMLRRLRIFRFGRYLGEANYAKFDSSIFSFGDNLYLDGYWQTEKYFKEYAGVIHSDFHLRNGLGAAARRIAEQISRGESASLHVRREDYVGLGWEIPAAYYEKALLELGKRVNHPQIFVFSDDVEWAKENIQIPYKTVYVGRSDGITSAEELVLMGECKHNIIANSSFSWWGAWLNKNRGKNVFVPVPLFKTMPDPLDWIPEDWNRIDYRAQTAT